MARCSRESILPLATPRVWDLPKATLLMPDGRTFVARIVRTLRDAGVTDLVIVTGRHHDAVVDTITREQRFNTATHRS